MPYFFAFLIDMSEIKILAIDTSLDICSVTLMIGDECTELYETTPKKHAEIILSFIDSLLKQNQLPISNIDALAFTNGPGSFTGIRIASSIVQSIAFVQHLPVIPISTLQALAQANYRLLKNKNVLVCLDARMQDVYLGGYQLNSDQIMINTISDTLLPPDQIVISTQENWIGIGNGWQVYDNKKIISKYQNITIIQENPYPLGKDIVTLAKYYFLLKKVLPAEAALPNYLRGDNIWRKNS